MLNLVDVMVRYGSGKTTLVKLLRRLYAPSSAAIRLDGIDRSPDLVCGRTAILSDHRFSTLRLANRIFVMDGGRIT